MENGKWKISQATCSRTKTGSSDSNICRGAISNLSTFPALSKLGYQKGKFIGFYIPIVFFSLIFVAYYLLMVFLDRNITFDFLMFVSRNQLLMSCVLTIIAAAIYLLSYKLSIKHYSQRDF